MRSNFLTQYLDSGGSLGLPSKEEVVSYQSQPAEEEARPVKKARASPSTLLKLQPASLSNPAPPPAVPDLDPSAIAQLVADKLAGSRSLGVHQ